MVRLIDAPIQHIDTPLRGPRLDLTFRGKARNQQAQQSLTRGQERPARTIQDPVIVDEPLLLAQPHDTQARRHRACARGENSANQQDFSTFPNGLGEQWFKLSNQGQQLGRPCQHIETSRGKSDLQLTLSAVTFSKIKNGQSRAERMQVCSEPLELSFADYSAGCAACS